MPIFRAASLRGIGLSSTSDALIYPEKSFSPKATPNTINILGSRLCGNDDFFSVFLEAQAQQKLSHNFIAS